ncbi:MAG: hypothetical protein ACMUHB_01335, partial [Thermoplasmatota archaeon]
YYVVYAKDVQGNYVESLVYEIVQRDTTPPRIGELDDHIFRANEEFTIIVEMWDNIRVTDVEWEGAPSGLNYADNVNLLTGSVEERGIYRIKVTIRDEEGNEAGSEFLLVIESSTEEPEKQVGPLWALMIIQFILIGLLFLVVFIQANYIAYIRKQVREIKSPVTGERYRERFGRNDDPFQRKLEEDYRYEE